MSDRKRSAVWACAGLAVVIGSLAVTFVVVVIAFGFLEDRIPDSIAAATGRFVISGFLLVAVAGPILVATWVARVLARRGWFAAVSTLRRPAWLVRAVVAAYVLTAVFGSPAVQTHTNAWAVTEYKRLKAEGDHRVRESHPYIATYLAVPVLPGVILTYHEYQLDGLYGFGGFQLFGWYGTGVGELWEFGLWVS